MVTGATGLVGSQVVRQLLASDVEVAALVRPGSDRRRLASITDKVQILEADLADRAAVAAQLALSRPEACANGNPAPDADCSGEPVTIAALMQTLGDLLGRPKLIRDHAYNRTIFTARKLVKSLSWVHTSPPCVSAVAAIQVSWTRGFRPA